MLIQEISITIWAGQVLRPAGSLYDTIQGDKFKHIDFSHDSGSFSPGRSQIYCFK